MKLDWRPIITYYQRLSARERTLVGVASGAMLVVSLYSFVWQPLVDNQALMKRRVVLKQKELVEIQSLRDAYLNLGVQFEASRRVVAPADPTFSLFPYIESTVKQVISPEHLLSMNPQTKVIANAYREESVELKLSNVPMKELVDMMYRIEKGDQAHPLRVTRLSIKKYPKDPHAFDVTATISMLQSAEG